jgi:hypothetical protein
MKKASQFFAISLLCLSVSACGKSKVEQCNAFIDRATKAQNAVNGLNLATDDKKELEKGASAIEVEAKAFSAVEVKDEKLAGFRDAYGKILADLGKILSDLATAQADAADASKAEAAATKVKTLVASAEALEKSESSLVDQINQYCSGTK